MLVKCPKCGFDQPKDTYCASCGIEMDSYKPIQPPFWKTAIKSPLMSLFVFVGLGYGAYVYLKNPSQFQFSKPSSPTIKSTPSNATETLGTQAANPNSAPPTTSEALPAEGSMSSAPTPPPPEPNPVKPEIVTAAPPPPSDVPKSRPPEDIEKPAQDKPEPTTARDTIPIESITGPLVVEIRFVEAPQSVVQSFLSEASDNSGGDSGEMSYAIVKNAASWINHKSFKELDRFTKSVPDVKKKLQWFSGTHEPTTGAPFGLDFQIAIQARAGGHLAGDIFLSRSMVDHTPGGVETQRKEFTTHFETDVGSVIGLVGVMPRTRYKAEDKDPLQDSLLKIFLSQAFLDGETDLLILMQFKSASK